MPDVISIHGARVHNLRNVDVEIPRDRMVVITGVSGSGKSSLAFDTIFAEGRRRYLESLSTYTRQFLNQLERPDIDGIDGLPPTICVDQRVGSVARRSTLATTTEIYDYLRLLYARAGEAHCPDCGRPVSSQSVQAIVDRILAFDDRRKVMILSPVVRGGKGAHRDVFAKIARDGFVRARVDGEIVDAADPPQLAATKPHDIEAVVDRIIVKDGIQGRLQESVDLAIRHGDGKCVITHQDDDTWHDQLYSTKFACPTCSLSFPDLEPRTFSFNSPYGACAVCTGLGVVSSANGGGSTGANSKRLAAKGNDGPADAAETQVVCSECEGERLGPFARRVTFAGKSLPQLTALSVSLAHAFVRDVMDTKLDAASEEVAAVAKQTLPEVARRLEFLLRVGLDYVSLDRPSNTLSGGEFQRARLASCLGAGLLGACYVLDEPTIGLHPRDTARLLATLEELRDQGN
ncbi:MAG: ABC-ATPase UvrA, partial [Planctomycetota bacterium]|nr:ABC-ATPase UvrA [Planctomycetota bacterium]